MFKPKRGLSRTETKFLVRGFTLIELLVVIAVIGLLASIVLVTVNNARVKARDTKRLSDLRQIALALELFYDEYGEYPDFVDSDPVDAGWDHSDSGDGFIKGLEDNTRGDNPNNISFMTKVPVDPINISDANHCGLSGNDLVYTYITEVNGQKYTVCAAFETIDVSDSGLVFECDNGSYPVYCAKN